MKLSLVVLFSGLLVPSVASAAPPSFEVLDRGAAIEVIAHNTKAARTAVVPTRSRLEVELAGVIYVPGLQTPDKILKVVEFDNNRLSVKTTFDRETTKILARYAQAIQVGEDLHLLFPRVVPADGATVELPEPTLPPALAAQLANKAGPKPEPKQEAPKPKASAPAAATAPPAPQPAAIANLNKEPPAAAAETKPATIGVPESDDTTSKITMYGALGLGAIGIGWWMLRKRKTAAGPTTQIEMLAQRSLGGKAKVVWLAAGGREMMVAVTPQNVRVLGQWARGSTEGGFIADTANDSANDANDDRALLPEAIAAPRTMTRRQATAATVGERTQRAPTMNDVRIPRAATRQGSTKMRAITEEPPAERPTDSAIAGILRLRAKTQAPVAPLAVNDDVATEDVEADSLWAREILAATAGRK